jgi:tetratricopeptide (TPR) repeat protein
MVEEIITALSRIRWLFVIARNSTFTYKGHAIDVKQVGRELGVRYVLEGSVRKAGGRVRITAQLIDAATGAHLWADRSTALWKLCSSCRTRWQQASPGSSSRHCRRPKPRVRQTARRVTLLHMISTCVPSRNTKAAGPGQSRRWNCWGGQSSAIQVTVRLLPSPPTATRCSTENLDAYDLFLRALAQMYKVTEEGTAEAIRLARRALELDPAFAPAMGRIAGARQRQFLHHWIPASGTEVEEGIHMARQALAAARDDPEVLRAAGLALAALAGENETALTALDRAIELNPNYALAYAQRGLVLAWLNRPDEAIAAAERGIRLSPNDPIVFPHGSYLALCLAHLVAGRYEEALSWADRALGSNAGLPSLSYKLSLCGHLGRREEASKCLQRLRETYPEPTVAAVMRGLGKGVSPEVAAHIAEGLRKAGLPEE